MPPELKRTLEDVISEILQRVLDTPECLDVLAAQKDMPAHQALASIFADMTEKAVDLWIDDVQKRLTVLAVQLVLEARAEGAARQIEMYQGKYPSPN